MLDLNNAPEQSEGMSSTAIPEGSVVPVAVTVRTPKAGKQSDICDALSTTTKGVYQMLDLEFEVMGTFSGRKIWENFNFKCDFVNDRLHFDGSDKTTSISMSKLRAIIESAKNVSPKDHSPQASAQRNLSSFYDLNNMVCLVKVDCKVEQSQKDGNWYVNNTIKKIITPDDEEYSRGEFISDKPLPPIPDAGAKPTATATPAAGAGWGATASATPAAQTPAPAGGGAPVPAWAKR